MRLMRFGTAVTSAAVVRMTLLAAVLVCCESTRSLAAEGSSLAGPIGGTDIRSAVLPPPGLYGGVAAAYGESYNFNDGDGNSVPALEDLEQRIVRAGVAALYVPEFQLFGGALGLTAIVLGGQTCGRLFSDTSDSCLRGFGDPYVELGWSRHFGTWRPSRYEGAYPIPEGLTIQTGIGVVIPIGKYSESDQRENGVTLGNNIWDIAPNAAFTYVTPPIIAEGTELSAKVFWNNYLENPDTDYQTGSLVNVDFALTERVGRFQMGLAGAYVAQIEDDEQFGVTVPPDGRRAEVLSLGFVGAYDIPEIGASVKIKGVQSVVSRNAVDAWGVSITFAKKLY